MASSAEEKHLKSRTDWGLRRPDGVGHWKRLGRGLDDEALPVELGTDAPLPFDLVLGVPASQHALVSHGRQSLGVGFHRDRTQC